MGMLMHHTWLEQQKTDKPVKEKATEVVAVEEDQKAEPAKKTAGRRKTSK